MKNKILIVVLIILFISIAIFILGGFQKRTDVVLTDYSISEDGTKIKLSVAISSSVGYTRGLKIKQGGDNKYITFYSTFGFVNSKLGAKNQFEIELNPSCTEIYFYKGDGGYNLVLEKNQITNEWEMIK